LVVVFDDQFRFVLEFVHFLCLLLADV
jgi:hypothetical protein